MTREPTSVAVGRPTQSLPVPQRKKALDCRGPLCSQCSMKFPLGVGLWQI